MALQHQGGVKQVLITTNLVGANVKCWDDGMQYRARQLSTGKVKGFTFGNSLGNGADPYGNVNIHPFDLLLTPRQIPNSTKEKHLTNRLVQFRPPTFSSFTGMEVAGTESTDKPITDERAELLRALVEQEYVAYGWSTEFYTFGEISQTDSGLTAAMAGSFTTRNTGINAIEPGALVRWRAPPVGTQKLQELRDKRKQLPGYRSNDPPDRFTAILEQYDPREGCVGTASAVALGLLRAIKDDPQWYAHKDTPDKVRYFTSDQLSLLNAVEGYVTHTADTGAGRAEATAMRDAIIALAGPLSSDYNEQQHKAERSFLTELIKSVGEMLHRSSNNIVARAINYSVPGGELNLVV